MANNSATIGAHDASIKTQRVAANLSHTNLGTGKNMPTQVSRRGTKGAGCTYIHKVTTWFVEFLQELPEIVIDGDGFIAYV